MSLAQRFERRLEGLVGGAFARVFKGQVEPVEIGSALQREANDKRNVMGNGQVLSPNRYRVTLSPSDHERLVPWERQLTNSLAELVQEYLDENRWATIGDIEVYLARDEDLRTGVFGVASRMEAAAPPRRRPHDSLSLPIIAGAEPGEYDAYGAAGPGAQGGQGAHMPNKQGYGAPGAYPPAGSGGPGAAAAGGAPAAAMGAAAAGNANGGMAPSMAPAGQHNDGPGHGQGGHGQSGHGAYAPPEQRQGLVMLLVDDDDKRFELRRGSNVIGRGTDADLQLLDQGISRRHVDIQFDGNVATAYDLGSTNGTSVNGHEVSSQLLRHGDVLRLGHTRIVFHQERR